MRDFLRKGVLPSIHSLREDVEAMPCEGVQVTEPEGALAFTRYVEEQRKRRLFDVVFAEAPRFVCACDEVVGRSFARCIMPQAFFDADSALLREVEHSCREVVIVSRIQAKEPAENCRLHGWQNRFAASAFHGGCLHALLLPSRFLHFTEAKLRA